LLLTTTTRGILPFHRQYPLLYTIFGREKDITHGAAAVYGASCRQGSGGDASLSSRPARLTTVLRDAKPGAWSHNAYLAFNKHRSPTSQQYASPTHITLTPLTSRLHRGFSSERRTHDGFFRAQTAYLSAIPTGVNNQCALLNTRRQWLESVRFPEPPLALS
jgi:hypothetical protein